MLFDEKNIDKELTDIANQYGIFGIMAATKMVKIILENLAKSESMHDIRRHNGNIEKDYIRDEKGKKVYLTYEDWKERNE